MPRVKHWLETTPQSMGNWVSKEAILQDLESINLEEIPVYENEIPLKKMNEMLQNNGKVTAIGFDILQVSRYKITFEK